MGEEANIFHGESALENTVLEYAQVAWAGVSMTDDYRLERLNRSAARLISSTGLSADVSHPVLLARAGLEPLKAAVKLLMLCLFADCSWVDNRSTFGHQLRVG